MKKEITIEYMRTISCLGVVMIHVFKSAHDCCEGLNQNILFLCSVFVNNLRWCVPVFLMITGSLLLQPEKKITFKKILRYIWRIVVILAVFGTGFALMELVFTEKTIKISMGLMAVVNTVAGNTWDHLWYLYTLIMLYCFLPLLRACSSMKKSNLLFTIFMMFLYSSVLATLKGFGVKLGISVGTVSVYMLYMLLGYTIKKDIIRIWKGLAAIGVIVSFIYLSIIGYCTDILQLTIDDSLINHSSVAVVIQSVCVYQLLLGLPKVKNTWLEKQFLCIAEASFGIYILHMFYINLVYKVFNINLNGVRALLLIPIYIMVFLCTYATTLLLRKNAVVRKYL